MTDEKLASLCASLSHHFLRGEPTRVADYARELKACLNNDGETADTSGMGRSTFSRNSATPAIVATVTDGMVAVNNDAWAGTGVKPLP
jgi:hypothetical protein